MITINSSSQRLSYYGNLCEVVYEFLSLVQMGQYLPRTTVARTSKNCDVKQRAMIDSVALTMVFLMLTTDRVKEGQKHSNTLN